MKKSLLIGVTIVLAVAEMMGFVMGPAWAIEPSAVTQLASKVQADLRTQVLVKKVNIQAALREQINFLVRNPDVQEVKELKGNNLFLRFKDGNELLMFLGMDRMGAASATPMPAQLQMQGVLAQAAEKPMLEEKVEKLPPSAEKLKAVIKPGVLAYLLPCAPGTNKALIFDCLDDDYNVVSPKISQQAKSDLQAMGHSVTVRLNNNANLANAALIDDGEYGVVLMRGHGADLGGDFGFLVRPWYTSYPPANSGYTGTIRASAYNHAANATQFGYVITGQFSSTYWTNKVFPGTFFFLESCHGADPGALPGMPTWTTNHGSRVWLGWNESVSFNCGDNGTKLFLQKVREGKSVGDAVAAVYATGCRPPELVSYPAGREGCRFAVWRSDPNEAATADNRDFKLMRLVSNGTNLFAAIHFYAAPSFDEYFFYADTSGTAAAEVLVKCHPNNVEVYRSSSPGYYNIKVYTGSAAIKGNIYSFSIPWKTAFGAATQAKIWLYDMTGKDRLPNSGSVTVTK